MKKILSLILTLMMLFALVACGDPVQNTGDSNSDVNAGTESNGGTSSDAEPETVPFADSVWGVCYMVGDDGYPKAPDGASPLIAFDYLDPTGETLRIYAKSYMNQPSFEGMGLEFVEYNGAKYYCVSISDNTDPCTYAEDGDTVTVSVNGKLWLTLKRHSATEYEILDCVKSVKSDLPVGLLYRAVPSEN